MTPKCERCHEERRLQYCAPCMTDMHQAVQGWEQRARSAEYERVPASQLEGAVSERDRYKAALDRLNVHPLLTRRGGPLEQGAWGIVRDALRGR